MKVCPKCGYIDHPYWRHSRFDFNADYCRWEEFKTIHPKLAEKLKDKHNFDPVENGEYIYYRRGSGGLFVYRVWKPDFHIKIERKRH